MSYIVENGHRVTYTFQDGKVIYSDGKQAVPSIENIDIKKAYQTAKEPVVVEPPVTIDPPVIIPPKGEVREMTMAEFGKLKDASDLNVKIKAGVYKDQYQPESLQNVNVDLSQVQVATQNMPFLEIKGHCNGLHFQGGSAKNMNRGVFSYKFDKRYDGTDATLAKDISIDGFVADNIGGALISIGSDIDNKGVNGGILGFKMTNCVVKNCPDLGEVAYLKNVENALVEGNTVIGVNTNSKNHNGIFTVVGNLTFRNNKISGHEGTGLRLCPTKISDRAQSVLIEKNIVRDSFRYGGFEVQVFSYLYESGFFKPVDILVQNNSVFNLNSDKVWQGQLIDIYDFYANMTVKNNLGGNLFAGNGDAITDMINYENVTKVSKVVSTGNKYFKTEAEAAQYKAANPGIGA